VSDQERRPEPEASDETDEEPGHEDEGPVSVPPATLPTDLLGGKFLDPSGR
jgi:hypothetical protein